MAMATTFEVIPAVDVSRGRLARYSADGPVHDPAFGGDAVAAAEAAVAAGASRLHVVDMDLAFGGALANLEVVRAVAGLGVRVQCGGGVRTAEAVHAMLEAGADRVVLGSGALADEEATSAIVSSLASSILVGIEVVDGRIRSRGRDPVDLPLASTLGWLVAIGVPGFLVTAVERVGTLRGPGVAVVRRVVRTGRPVIAAGGVAGADDLDALRRAGAAGAVVGRAALDGDLSLNEVFGRP
jgi:phosphoribosylformimino-5-aminoimidazole carboxamide ribotide isomerase